LRVQQHEVVFAVRDVNAAAPLLREHQFEFVPLPDLSQRGQAIGSAIRSYSGILAAAGFCDAEGLLTAVSAWRSLLTLLRPRAIVFDHAPTGLLAARAMGIPRVVMGSGFTVPPRRDPFLAFCPGSSISITELEAADQRVLEVVNGVCRELGLPLLARLEELFDVDGSFLCTFPELDHYRERESGVRYWGPIALGDGFESPVWPLAHGPKIFVYLRPS